MSDSKFYIIYPGGNKSQLKVLELSNSCDYELDDYAVASRQSFFNEDEAEEYAKNLAQSHNKEFISKNKNDYLD